MNVNLYQKFSNSKLVGGISITTILFSLGFAVYSFSSLQNHYLNSEKKVDQLEADLYSSERGLYDLKTEYLATLELLRTEKQNNAYFEEKINSISNTVGILEKLSKTDSELLKKYSKVYFLNENYIPLLLTEISDKYLFTKGSRLQIHSQVHPYLTRLLDYAIAQGMDLLVISAYRSFGTQAHLKSSYRVTYGSGTANKFSADQGYSEHQLGTTVDFTTTKTGANFIGFDKTESYKWLIANAHKYGFILSYPKQNTYYAFEPWHWRFVGIALATRIYNENLNFYSLDQREIDQSLVNLFD